MRIPRPWHHPLAAGRLLLPSTFPEILRRPTPSPPPTTSTPTSSEASRRPARLTLPRRPIALGAQPLRPLGRLSQARLPSSRNRPAPIQQHTNLPVFETSPHRRSKIARSNPAHPQNPPNHSSDPLPAGETITALSPS